MWSIGRTFFAFNFGSIPVNKPVLSAEGARARGVDAHRGFVRVVCSYAASCCPALQAVMLRYLRLA